jgi:hypothetical protein
MKAKLFVTLILSFAMIFLLSACGGRINGIDSPVTVDDTELQITSAKLQDTIDIGTQTLRPSSSGDTILSVTASSSKENPKLEVSVTDNNGRSDTPSVTQSSSGDGKTSVTWFIGVSKAADSFTFHLPGDIAVPLDSLLK